jgi:monoamine oxidase
VIHDAIVVGAGLSGLVCARRLTAAGADVVVIEARDRVGGRLHSGRLAGDVIDLGGQWITSGQPRVVALATELGAATFRHVRDGRVHLVEETRGVFSQLAAAIATWRAVRGIRRTSRALPIGEPAAALDQLTLEDWLARTITNRVARDRIALHAELVFAAAPADLSLLLYLSRLAATGDFAPRGSELPGGGREHRFADGAQTLALRLADLLGERITLGDPVVAIDDAGDHVVARGARHAHQARRLVLAVPPVLARTIAIDLAPAARSLAEATRMGPVVKCFAAYDRAFWRDDGSSGELYRARGTVRATVELITPGGVPALLAFVVGPTAVGWANRDPADRRAEILAILVEEFGPAAGAPLEYVDVDWGADPWSAGCVAGVGPGVLSTGACWRAPHGRIHLAGTESALAWPGYMEGAIEAGERAAAEVLAALHG